VTLLSNVLYKNSAVQHQTLGTRIHRVIEAMHPYQTVTAEGIPIAASFGENLIGYEEKRNQRLQIVNIQAALKKLGYPVGEVDGKAGSNTHRAIKIFQKDLKIRADGKPSAALLEKLNGALANHLQLP
jgi:N-acetyl-anhydromuramyl-L-alanine amidase AmpD